LRVRVLWFGRPTASPFERQVEVYRKRVQSRWPADDLPLRPADGREGDACRALALEAKAVHKHVPKGWRLVALDEGGDALDSEAFARLLADAEDRGTPGVAFTVGSDLGLDPGLRKEAWRSLSLSTMTLPHLLARLVLWEQLFRAIHILGGGRYHRHRVQ